MTGALPTFADDLELVRAAVAEAGRVALGYWRKDPEVFWKGSSPVSEADFAADRSLKETLLGARPGYGWVSEETATEPASAGSGGRFFVVDPIDGTRSFLRGETTWCVSVAVIEDGRPVAAAIDVPAAGEVFLATADGPALLDGRAIRAADEAEEAVLRLSMPDVMASRLAGSCERGFALEPNVPALAYRLALVAAGRLDGTIVGPRANDWDIAAADLILERAGGVLAGLDRGPHLYKQAPERHGVLVAGGLRRLERLRRYGRGAAG